MWVLLTLNFLFNLNLNKCAIKCKYRLYDFILNGTLNITQPRNKEHSCKCYNKRSRFLAVIVRQKDSERNRHTDEIPNAWNKTEISVDSGDKGRRLCTETITLQSVKVVKYLWTKICFTLFSYFKLFNPELFIYFLRWMYIIMYTGNWIFK